MAGDHRRGHRGHRCTAGRADQGAAERRARKIVRTTRSLARLWYTSINPTVKPLDNIDCRKAIMYGMSPTPYQNAYGGQFAGGEIATTMLPPTIPGYEDFDLWGRRTTPTARRTRPRRRWRSAVRTSRPTSPTGPSGPRRRPPPRRSSRHWRRSASRPTPKPLPEGDYFSATCRPPVVRGEEQHRHVRQRLGCRLARRLRLPVPDRRQPGHPADRWLVQHVGPHPRGRHDARQGHGRAGRGQARNKMWAEIDKRVMEEAVIYPGVYAKAVLLRGRRTSRTCSSTRRSATTTTPRWV